MTETEIINLLHITSVDKVLDIGGSMKQLTEIKVDTLVDIIHPKDSKYNIRPLTAKHFVKLNIEKQKLPFKDKQFDICICAHTLEDLHFPFLIIDEMSRVAKKGIIITPSRGLDCLFDRVNYTDWKTGARRVPGISHHHWLFEYINSKLVITPKNYPLLYSTNMNITGWSGEKECVYVWKDNINYLSDIELNLDFSKLIQNYKKFITKNITKIKLNPVILYLDNPFVYLKEFIKMIWFKK